MKPIIYKIKDSFFINQTLCDFIRSKTADCSTTIESGEVLYFMRNVKFQRSLLDICPKKLSRVIKPENATTIIVENMSFSTQVRYLDGSTIHNDPNGKIDDTVFSLAGMSDLDVLALKGWMEIYESGKEFKYVYRTVAEREITSGFVIDETNIDVLIGAIETDKNFVMNTINSCDFEKSKLFILYLLFFTEGRWNSGHYKSNELSSKTLISLLTQIDCKHGVSGAYLKQMYANPTLYSMLYPRIVSKLSGICSTTAGTLGIDNVEFIITLKQ